MVFYFRTRLGYDKLCELIGKVPSPIWAEKHVLDEPEIDRLRTNGIDLTVFTLDASDEPDLDTIKMHHPNDVIWVEY